MNEILEKIKTAKHIEIVVDSEHLFVASALYTYILTLHKKVSLVCKENSIDLKFSFLAWFDKIKKTDTPSADYSVELQCDVLDLYNSFKLSNIKINKKMATALYGGILYETQGFTNAKVDGTVFAVSGELIKAGAQHILATTFLMKRVSLGALRLKSIMFKNMRLLNNAKAAVFILSESDFKASSTDVKDAQKIMQEAFGLMYVDTVLLLDSDRENEVIKILSKEI